MDGRRREDEMLDYISELLARCHELEDALAMAYLPTTLKAQGIKCPSCGDPIVSREAPTPV